MNIKLIKLLQFLSNYFLSNECTCFPAPFFDISNSNKKYCCFMYNGINKC